MFIPPRGGVFLASMGQDSLHAQIKIQRLADYLLAYMNLEYNATVPMEGQ